MGEVLNKWIPVIKMCDEYCSVSIESRQQGKQDVLVFAASMYRLFRRNFPERMLGLSGKASVKNRSSPDFSEGNLTAKLVIFSTGTFILRVQQIWTIAISTDHVSMWPLIWYVWSLRWTSEFFFQPLDIQNHVSVFVVSKSQSCWKWHDHVLATNASFGGPPPFITAPSSRLDCPTKSP